MKRFPKMTRARLAALLFALAFQPSAHSVTAQQRAPRELRPDLRRALATRPRETSSAARKNGYQPLRAKHSLPKRPRATATNNPEAARRRAPARVVGRKTDRAADANSSEARASVLPRISAGTPLSRVLHTSQLSIFSADGTHEQLADQTGDLEADERTTFDTDGGSFDIALGRSGARYEVFSAVDDRGTSSTGDDIPVGVLVVALDTNGDYVRDFPSTYDLERDFGLPSAVSVVSGTSRAGREFVVVSSSGYYNFDDPSDPFNEPSAGVVLLVRDASTGGFDPARSRSLISVGSNQLNNANALALLPGGDLLVADFTSNELRVVRDTDGDRVPDTLDQTPFYSYRFSDDAPLDIAANPRGVVFSHSFGNDALMLAVYDTDGDGRGDVDEVVVEGLSLDNNLILHGLTVDREGTVYVIEDASGAADTAAVGGNLGEPRIDAFPDPALNGILRDGALFFFADDPQTQSLTGLAFGVETFLPPVGRLQMANSASLRPPATRDGLATITGAGLTLGRSGATQGEAQSRGVSVWVEGRSVSVLSFDDSRINVHLPPEVFAGVNSVVVYVDGNATAADDASVAEVNPGLFTYAQNGAGEAVALLASGMRYTAKPFPARFDGQPSVISLFGTGWRNASSVSVTVGGRPATVHYAGRSGGFPGLDQLDFVVPEGVSGAAQVLLTTPGGATSRTDVFVTIN